MADVLKFKIPGRVELTKLPDSTWFTKDFSYPGKGILQNCMLLDLEKVPRTLELTEPSTGFLKKFILIGRNELDYGGGSIVECAVYKEET